MRLLDGPVEGEFMVGRCPQFVRAVLGPRGKKDVLDQLEDEPASGERVFVYAKTLDSHDGHMCVRGFGCFQMGDYRYLSHVDGEQLRETAAWRAWAEAQPVEHVAAVED